MATTSQYSNFRNVSGVTKFFGFLGYRGATLAPSGGYSAFGDPFDWLFGHGKTRAKNALEYALNNSLIELTHTPQPVLHDASTASSKLLNLNSGTLGVIDPDWGAYSGSQ
jgi:hypothetical protein